MPGPQVRSTPRVISFTKKIVYTPEEQCTHEIFNTSDLFEEEVPDTAPEELPGIGAVSDSNEKSDSEDYRSEEEDKDSDQEDTDPSASIPIPVSTPTEATEPQCERAGNK